MIKKATDVDEMSLPALLKAMQPAVAEMDRVKDLLGDARVGHKRITVSADAARNAAIAQANATRQEAEAVFQAAVKAATSTHQTAIALARRDLDEAEARYATACAEAQPLLEAFSRRCDGLGSR